MGHGGGGGHGAQSAEPNLTPLLDMVLQLVMFFMLVANFIMDELSDKIRLPVASQAKPLTVKDTNFMYLNVDRTGRILVPLGEPLLTPEQIRFYMGQAAKNHVLGEAKALEEVTVIIRADKDARFEHVHKTMIAIKRAGFRKLQFRAVIDTKKR
jgi:biopolymer transport protein ExbD